MREGLLVRTNPLLERDGGFCVVPQQVANRKANEVGIVRGWIPGHGGDGWWVEHRNEKGEKFIAPYWFTEFHEYGEA